MTTAIGQSATNTFSSFGSMILSVASSIYALFCEKPVCIADIVTPYLAKRGSFQSQQCQVNFCPSSQDPSKMTARKIVKTLDAQNALAREKICLGLCKDSPHVVHMVDGGGSEGAVSMEDAGIDMITLMTELGKGERTAPLPAATFASVSTQFMDGLKNMHDAGVQHNDLKLGNLAIDGDGEVRIIDLGHASAPSVDLHAPIEFGTAGYLAPEYFNDPGDISTKTDIFAAGVVLYKLLTGTHLMPAFETAQEAREYNESLCSDKGAFESQMSQSLGYSTLELDKYEDLIGRMLSWSPDDRPSAEEVLETLKKLQ